MNVSLKSNCNHICVVGDYTKDDIIAKQDSVCETCQKEGPFLWVCLHRDCLYVGCNEAPTNHCVEHYQAAPDHCLFLNLTSLRVYCLNCECEVFLENNDPPIPGMLPPHPMILHTPPDSDSEGEAQGEEALKPRGLTGLQNIGNTCYMNSALQALSNCPQLTNFFLDCSPPIKSEKKHSLAKSYMRLMKEMWHRKRPSYVVPTGIACGIKMVCPVFRGYTQQDAQEFLRCFMDQLHEELKEPLTELPTASSTGSNNDTESAIVDTISSLTVDSGLPPSTVTAASDSEEGDFETCDSGLSSDKEEHSVEADEEGCRCRGDAGTTAGSVSYTEEWRHRQKAKVIQWHSIISDTFDGKLLSAVECLTCDTVSTTRETFQDLSLPIPTRDHLHLMHSSKCTDVYSQKGWLSSLVGWLMGLVWGPSVSLEDCLTAFFSADELKGDNMYSCEKCRKLRNGIKYSRLLQLPEVLCIHLKRFRHEVMFSSKIGSYVSFPLEGLDLARFLHKSYPIGVTTYDLSSVICHHGTAGCGHYTTYSLNHLNDQWYEFDDQYVTAVDPETVRNCEAYVLFYRKRDDEMVKKRLCAVELMERSRTEQGLLKFHISKQWINRFNHFAEPGPISNTDFLCQHGGVPPQKATITEELCTVLPQAVWEYLHDTFGGGPPCTHLYICPICQSELDDLNKKRKTQLHDFNVMNAEFERVENPSVVYAISMTWFKTWEAFVCRDAEPPAPIDNSSICSMKNNQPVLKLGSDYCSVSREMYLYLQSLYGGGPDLPLHQPKSTNKSLPATSVAKSPAKSATTNTSQSVIVDEEVV